MLFELSRDRGTVTLASRKDACDRQRINIAAVQDISGEIRKRWVEAAWKWAGSPLEQNRRLGNSTRATSPYRDGRQARAQGRNGGEDYPTMQIYLRTQNATAEKECRSFRSPSPPRQRRFSSHYCCPETRDTLNRKPINNTKLGTLTYVIYDLQWLKVIDNLSSRTESWGEG